jgi:2-dehydropantoate 2-reductase
MRTLIVGTGVIGTIYGWALDKAGAEVSHLVRPGSAVTSGPVLMDVLDERKGHPRNPVEPYHRDVVDRLDAADGYDLVLVPVNAFQLEDALEAVASATDPAPIVIMSSNWAGTDAIERHVAHERYVLAYADDGGTIERDGSYWVNIGPELHAGLLPGQPADGLETLRAAFAPAGIALDVPGDIVHWLWVHNASAVGFAGGFARHESVREFLADRATLADCFRATRELLAVCERRGVDVGRYPDVSMLRYPTWLTIPMMRWQWTHNASMQRYTAHAATPGAMRELDESCHAMLATADELGVPVPTVRALVGSLDDRVRPKRRIVTGSLIA